MLEVVLLNRQYVLLNMDETSMPIIVTKKRGHVVQLPRGGAQAQQCERVAARDARGNMTLVAFISSLGALQEQLPQFLLTRDKMLSAVERRRLCDLEAPLTWLQGTNGWMTCQLLCRILTSVRRSVHRHAPGHELVLLLDSAPQHVHAHVLAHAARAAVFILPLWQSNSQFNAYFDFVRSLISRYGWPGCVPCPGPRATPEQTGGSASSSGTGASM